jgi:methanogenic corrinoid protein MtbC1
VIGLSLSVDRRLGGLAAQIADIRGDSANERVAVMVGGRVFSDSPGLAEEVGADVFADSAEDAPELAGEIVAEREHLVS